MLAGLGWSRGPRSPTQAQSGIKIRKVKATYHHLIPTNLGDCEKTADDHPEDDSEQIESVRFEFEPVWLSRVRLSQQARIVKISVRTQQSTEWLTITGTNASGPYCDSDTAVTIANSNIELRRSNQAPLLCEQLLVEVLGMGRIPSIQIDGVSLHSQWYSFAMALHPRLGVVSPARVTPVDVMPTIFTALARSRFTKLPGWSVGDRAELHWQREGGSLYFNDEFAPELERCSEGTLFAGHYFWPVMILGIQHEQPCLRVDYMGYEGLGWSEFVTEDLLRPITPVVPIPLAELEEGLLVEVRLRQRATADRTYSYCWVLGAVQNVMVQHTPETRERVQASALRSIGDTNSIWIEVKLECKPADALHFDRVVVPYRDVRRR